MCPPGFAEEVIYTYKRLVSVCVVTTVLLLHHYYVYIVATTTSGTVFFIFPDGQILSHEPGRVWWVHGYMGRGSDRNSPIHSPPPPPPPLVFVGVHTQETFSMDIPSGLAQQLQPSQH